MVETYDVGYNNANVKVKEMQPLKCMKKGLMFSIFHDLLITTYFFFDLHFKLF
jgi:hypothetical protein